MIIRLWKDKASQPIEIGKNISCASVIFSTFIPGTKLTVGHEQVDVV